MRLIGSRRVSTNGQLDGYGLDVQEADLRAYARDNGHDLVRIETDGAKSGGLPADERPGLLAALKAIRAGEADGLLVPGDLDRLARELVVQEAIMGQVWRSGGVVHTTTRGEVLADDPDDPMRTALRQMMGVFSQLDRALIAKRMRNGRKAKHAQGGYAGYGSPPLGWRAHDHELVPDGAEAAAVARIRDLRDGGASIRAIVAAMTAEGHKPKRGGDWHPETIRRVLARTA
jgi:DNA invertase Pin-like site-specific DNA recombinase